MPYRPRSWPTFAAEVLSARDSLQLADEVGLALRADRQRLGLSQRAYAARRSWTLATVIRLESAAGALKLGDVVAALEGTPFQLCLCHRPPTDDPGPAAPAAPHQTAAGAGEPAPESPSSAAAAAPSPSPSEPPTPHPVHPAYWPRSELVARVRGGSRRFPAHHVTEQVGEAPPWWWYAESSRAGSVSPDWYAPQYTRRRPPAS